jgi:hypothetical protein
MQLDKRSADQAKQLRRLVVAGVLALSVVVFLLRLYVNPSTAEQKTAFIQTMGGIVGGLTLFVGLYFTWRGIRDAWQQATYRGQVDGLQNYFQEMGKLLNEHDLLNSPNNAPVRAMAQGGTWAVIQMVDTHYKYFLLQFLYQARLVNGEDSVISLRGVHLWGINLVGDDLSYINLRGTDLTISPWTRRPSMLVRSTLRQAILQDVDFDNADLTYADLRGANLIGANLIGANLMGVNLSDANLTGAHVTEAQLATCRSLQDATMPNGQKYQDWLNDKERQGDSVENSSP